MDNRRFDSLTRAFASGQSRRSVLKGLLGFGGAAAVSTVVADETDARRSRGGSHSNTASSCQGEVCGTFCCEAPESCNEYGNACCADGTHACATTASGCCADCNDVNFPTVCGFDCCESDDACCDAECCPTGEVCVANILDCSNYFCEERCCVEEQICDGRCCHGVCFWPIDSIYGDDDDDDTERDCCPPFATYCPYMHNSNYGICCDAGSECCYNDGPFPTCIDPATQCCEVQDCVNNQGGEEACWSCEDNTCIAVPRGDQGGCEDCYGCSGIQECVPNPTVNGETCGEGGFCCDGTCEPNNNEVFYCPASDTCCDTDTEACCDVDGCCNGVCFDSNGGRDSCCPTGDGGLFCDVTQECCTDPDNEKCCGDAGCCAGQCYDGDNACCPKASGFVPEGSDVCCLNAENYCSVDGCCAGSCNTAGGCCEKPTSFACGTGCCDTDTQKCCDSVCISRDLCCESLGDCGDLTCCGGVCVDTTNDSSNCGVCDTVCPTDPDNCLESHCVSGSCSQSQSTCLTGQICDGSGNCCISTGNSGCVEYTDCCGLDYCDDNGTCQTSS